MQLHSTPLITAEQIRRRIAELAEAISRDYAGRELVLMVVLKGGIIFAADLMRALTVPVTVEVIRARSYEGTRSSGRVEFTCLPEQSVAEKHVLIIEDIIDTGRTASVIVERLQSEHPAGLAVCTLLDKPSRREVPIALAYAGFTIEDHFVVGYGLDYEQHGRELPGIYFLEGEPSA